MVREYVPELDVLVFENLRGIDGGDIELNPLDLNGAMYSIASTVQTVIGNGAKIALFGGDHLATLPTLRGLSSKVGPIDLVHFDAHTDLSEQAWGQRYHHGTWLRRAYEEGLVAKTIQIGVRGPYAERPHGSDPWAGSIDTWSMQRLRASRMQLTFPDFRRPVYVTFDVDVLDPSVAPGTGTPVPGGLTSSEALSLLSQIPVSYDIVGYDVVEVCPAYDHASLTSLVAVNVSMYILALLERRIALPGPV